MNILPMSNNFGAIIEGVDLSSNISANFFSEINDSFEKYAFLIFKNQYLTEESQNSFTNLFGPLGKPAAPFRPPNTDRLKKSESADISNVDEFGKLLKDDDPRILINKANALWHTDSSFKRIPAKMSLLHAQTVVTNGGETEFADMRAAWDDLSINLKKDLDGLVAEHDYFHSRKKVGLNPDSISLEKRMALPPVPQVLVRNNIISQRKSLYIASHISKIYGLSAFETDSLLANLFEHSTKKRYIYSHQWSINDVLMWDNRCTMHRGRPHDPKMPRVMRRSTALEVVPSVSNDWKLNYPLIINES